MLACASAPKQGYRSQVISSFTSHLYGLARKGWPRWRKDEKISSPFFSWIWECYFLCKHLKWTSAFLPLIVANKWKYVSMENFVCRYFLTTAVSALLPFQIINVSIKNLNMYTKYFKKVGSFKSEKTFCNVSH